MENHAFDDKWLRHSVSVSGGPALHARRPDHHGLNAGGPKAPPPVLDPNAFPPLPDPNTLPPPPDPNILAPLTGANEPPVAPDPNVPMPPLDPNEFAPPLDPNWVPPLGDPKTGSGALPKARFEAGAGVPKVGLFCCVGWPSISSEESSRPAIRYAIRSSYMMERINRIGDATLFRRET
jgi:hypothetical protein